MSQSEGHFYLEENYSNLRSWLIADDLIEAFDVRRALEGMEDPPSEYEIDRALDFLARVNDDVDIVEVDGGNVYDVSDFDYDSHRNILEEYFEI